MSMRFALLGATAMVLAGCSSDASRLSDFSGGTDRTATGTTGVNSLRPPDQIGGGNHQATQSPAPAAPGFSTVQSSPLPPPAAMPSRPAYSTPATPSPRLSAGSRAAPVQQVATTATTAPGRSGHWTAAGGTPITARAG